MTDFTLPTVHLNGTSRQMLADGYLNAQRKLRDAIDAFHAIEFNARDYDVAGSGAWPAAVTQRDCAKAHLHRVRDYLDAHLMHLGA